MGGALERVQIFILAEGLKVEFLLSGRRSSLVQSFCQSCVYFDFAVQMIQRFVIQGHITMNGGDIGGAGGA